MLQVSNKNRIHEFQIYFDYIVDLNLKNCSVESFIGQIDDVYQGILYDLDENYYFLYDPFDRKIVIFRNAVQVPFDKFFYILDSELKDIIIFNIDLFV
jgi:hypothetical protein